MSGAIAGTTGGLAAEFGLARAAAAAFGAGFGCMAAELTAVRLLAPYFGDSAYVWTNVIGVILVALALGACLGGRLAAAPSAGSWPARLLLASALLLGLAPWFGGPLGRFLIPDDLPLDAAMPALVRGSLVASAVLFVPAMLLLGAVSPLLVSAAARAGAPVGRAAGWISAAGTIGSLCGTFGATHWLVPQFGSRIALVAAAVALALAALLVARRRPAAGAIAALLSIGGLLLPAAVQPARPGELRLAELESRYQYLQVVQQPGVPGQRTLLRINEGLDSYHSVAIAGSAFTGGAYYDWHGLVPGLLPAEARERPWRALSIGDAAGSLRRVYQALYPGVMVDGVDIDPATMQLGDAHFPGPKAAGRRFAVDGRVFVANSRDQWQVIHVDAYSHQVYVPAHLASHQFFARCRERLVDGGVLACNVGALRPDDPVLRAIGTTLAAEFGHALAVQVPNTRNFLLVARRGAQPDPAQVAGLAELPLDGLSPADQAHWRRLVDVARDATLWIDVADGGPVLDDDRPVLDQLLHDSYVARLDVPDLLDCTGAVDPAGAELAAYEERRRRNWPGVLAAVAGSRAPTALLREYAGDARWSMRQLEAAVAEYSAALTLAGDPASQQRLRGNLAILAEEVQPLRRAHQVGTRNAWLEALLLAALAATGCAVLWRSRAA